MYDYVSALLNEALLVLVLLCLQVAVMLFARIGRLGGAVRTIRQAALFGRLGLLRRPVALARVLVERRRRLLLRDELRTRLRSGRCGALLRGRIRSRRREVRAAARVELRGCSDCRGLRLRHAEHRVGLERDHCGIKKQDSWGASGRIHVQGVGERPHEYRGARAPLLLLERGVRAIQASCGRRLRVQLVRVEGRVLVDGLECESVVASGVAGDDVLVEEIGGRGLLLDDGLHRVLRRITDPTG